MTKSGIPTLRNRGCIWENYKIEAIAALLRWMGNRDAEWQYDYRVEIIQPIQLGELCPKYRKLLRQDVVRFGEAVDMGADTLYEIVSKIDILINVGTSAPVYSIANLLRFFKETKEKYLIDPNPT